MLDNLHEHSKDFQTANATALVLTPAPYPTESLNGYFLRVSELNGYPSPWFIFLLAGLNQAQMQALHLHTPRLSPVMNKPLEVFTKLLHRTENDEIVLLSHCLGKHTSYTPYRTRSPRICVACIEKYGFIDALWDLELTVVCPEHGTPLTEVCNACHEPLSWMRPGLLKCRCKTQIGSLTKTSEYGAAQGLIAVLRNVLHNSAEPLRDNPYSLPMELQAFTLLELVLMISTLGQLATSSKSATTLAVLQGAASALADWPNGFHHFLHDYVARHSANMISTGLRKRCNSLYTALFKNKRLPKSATEFLRREFIRFGQQYWGEVVVDRKLLRNNSTEARYVSKNECARQLGIQRATLNEWIERGKLPAKAVSVGKRTLYIMDLQKLDLPILDAGRTFDLRQAARHLGIPVSVLQQLKASGRLLVQHQPRGKTGYHERDLDAFKEALLNRSEIVSHIPDAFIGLRKVLQNMKFSSPSGKTQLLTDYLDGKVKGLRRDSSSLDDVFVNRSEIEELWGASRCTTLGGYSMQEAAKRLQCNASAISHMIKQGHLQAFSIKAGQRITAASLEAFNNRYIALSVVGKRLNMSSKALLHSGLLLERDLLSVSLAKSRLVFVDRKQSSKLEM